MRINLTMRKECATTATTNTEEQKNPGIVLTPNSTQLECVKTVT